MSLKALHNNTSFQVGDLVRVHYKLIEKEKEAGRAKREVKEKIRERIQVFEGICIAIRGSQNNKTFTVRKIASNAVGVERIFPLISPWIDKITVKKKGKVRRAKLYYLRKKLGKEAVKIKERESKKLTKKRKTKKSTKKTKTKSKKVNRKIKKKTTKKTLSKDKKAKKTTQKKAKK